VTRVPLLIISDAPSYSSGLGRITKDLATRLHTNCSDAFRVATLGYGSPGSRHLPFMQYNIEHMENWFIPCLKEVWDDFAGDEQGIVFTIWDASRLIWFSQPDYCRDPQIREWLKTRHFMRAGYFPIDAYGPDKKLSVLLNECIVGYERILCYSKWAEGIVRKSLGDISCKTKNISYLPHGIDCEVFQRRPRIESRKVFHEKLGYKGPEVAYDETVIGIVATNQARKDYGAALQVVSEISKAIKVRLFIQVDQLERYWSIPCLLEDFGLMDKAIVNCVTVSDEIMSYVYSACDVTLGIGLGEGFGYPIFESLACGTPSVAISYGGHAEWMDEKCLVHPESFRLEGPHNCYRPVVSRSVWKDRILQAITRAHAGTEFNLPVALDWNNLWPEWEKWFRGLIE